jgi:hypothetical protein
MNLKRLVIIFMFMIVAGCSKEPEELSTVEYASTNLSIAEIKGIGETIEFIEDSLFNVRMDSNSVFDYGPSATGPWTRTPKCMLASAIFGGKEGQKAKIDVHKNIMPWKQGAAPYLDMKFSVSYDGEKGMYKKDSISYGGKTKKRKEAIVVSEIPWELRTHGYDKLLGLKSSIFYYHSDNPNNITFSRLFEIVASLMMQKENPGIVKKAGADMPKGKRNTKMLAFREDLNGIECIRIGIELISGAGREAWWLDPNRGFSLLKYEHYKKDKEGEDVLVNSIEVVELLEASGDIWWPTKSILIDRRPGQQKPEEIYSRLTCIVSSVVVNDVKLKSDAYEIQLPADYSVNKRKYERKTIK